MQPPLKAKEDSECIVRVYEAIDGLFPASPFLPHPPSLKAWQVWFVLIKANPRECFEPSQVLKLSSLIVQTPVQGSLSFSEALCLFFTSFSKVTLFIASIRILQELSEKTEPLFFCSFWFHNSFRGFCSRWQSAVKKPVWFVLETLCNQRLPWDDVWKEPTHVSNLRTPLSASLACWSSGVAGCYPWSITVISGLKQAHVHVTLFNIRLG